MPRDCFMFLNCRNNFLIVFFYVEHIKMLLTRAYVYEVCMQTLYLSTKRKISKNIYICQILKKKWTMKYESNVRLNNACFFPVFFFFGFCSFLLFYFRLYTYTRIHVVLFFLTHSWLFMTSCILFLYILLKFRWRTLCSII